MQAAARIAIQDLALSAAILPTATGADKPKAGQAGWTTPGLIDTGMSAGVRFASRSGV